MLPTYTSCFTSLPWIWNMHLVYDGGRGIFLGSSLTPTDPGWAPADQTRNPPPDMKQCFMFSPHHGRECSKSCVLSISKFKHHGCKPEMKHEKHITSALHSTWNHRPKVKQRHLGPSSARGAQSHPTWNTPNMKRHLWEDFHPQQLSRLRATDAPQASDGHSY